MPGKLKPVNIAPSAFWNALSTIEPGVWGTPCAIRLKNGRFIDRGIWINPQDVEVLSACAKRMPLRFATVLRSAGESGMGYHIYVVDLRDGTSFVHAAGNVTIDLVDLPPGYLPDDIAGVRPHDGRERSQVEGYRHIEDFASVEYALPGGDAL
jgi:hypothetical protein